MTTLTRDEIIVCLQKLNVIGITVYQQECIRQACEMVMRRPSLEFNLAQAKNLVDAFGGEDADVTVRYLPAGSVHNDDDDEPGYISPAGLYLHYTEYPEEGVIGLDELKKSPKAPT